MCSADDSTLFDARCTERLASPRTCDLSVRHRAVDRGPPAGQRMAKAVDLIEQMKDDAHAFIVNAKVPLQVADQVRAGQVNLGKLGRRLGPLRNQPLFLDPDLERRRPEGRQALQGHQVRLPR